MKTIKFNEVEYNLVYYVFEENTKIRVTILKEDYTIPEVADEIKDTTTIEVKEDSEVIAQFNNFSTLVALQIFSNYPVDGGATDTVISIELVNADLQAQIDDLNAAIAQQTQAINSKVDSSVIAEVEEIGGKSKNPYEVNETFMGDDGKYYKAVATINTGNILVVNGNIEETNVNETIKESEGE